MQVKPPSPGVTVRSKQRAARHTFLVSAPLFPMLPNSQSGFNTQTHDTQRMCGFRTCWTGPCTDASSVCVKGNVAGGGILV